MDEPEGTIIGRDSEKETHTEDTLLKVREALMKTGLAEDDVTHCISDMQNAGILFRERAEEDELKRWALKAMENPAIAVMGSDNYDEGYAAGRRWQAPRSFEGGREVGQAQVKAERKEWFKANVIEKKWAIDPETGGVVMTPELFGQIKAALTTVWDQAIARFRNCMDALDLSKVDDSPEGRVREYMRNSFSSATIEGVISAMKGDKR